MGNQQSQGPTIAATTAFPAKGRRRISKSPLLQSFIDSANRPRSTPKSLPSLGGTWYETSSPLYTGRTVASSQQKSSNSTRAVQVQQQHPPGGAKNLNQQQQQIVSQTTTTTTTQRPSGDPNAPYYVVSTTTYYVNSPASSSRNTINSESITSIHDNNQHQQRFSYISQTSSNGSSSAISDNIFTTTATATTAPSVFSRRISKGFEYITLNQRKFMSVPGIPYRLVCDDEESDRLVILHFLLKYAFNGNTAAPVKPILQEATLCTEKTNQRPQVLDIGCGPGTWVLEMASEYPNTDFVGVDIHPMFPCTIKPSNANFHQCNVLDGLPFADNTFDYVHVRMMLLWLTQSQALQLLTEITRVLKPGAMVELLDVEYRIQRPGPISDTLINQKLYHYFEDTYQIRLDSAHHLSTSLTRADYGFVDVHQDHVTIPLGPWGGQLGEIHGQNLVSGFIRGLDPDILETVMDQHLSLSEEKAIAMILQECQKYQSHLNWHVSYGCKPKTSSRTTPMARSKTASTLAPSSSSAAPSSSTTAASTTEQWDLIKEFADGYMD